MYLIDLLIKSVLFKIKIFGDKKWIQHSTIGSSFDSIRCNGLWKEMDPIYEVGWFYFQGDQSILLGVRRTKRLKTLLHTKMKVLLWAMTYILDHHVNYQEFETDCSNLIQMTQTLEECPAFAILIERFLFLRTRFQNFSLSMIPPLSNLKADCLTRLTRSKFIKLSNVSIFPLSWITNCESIFLMKCLIVKKKKNGFFPLQLLRLEP